MKNLFFLVIVIGICIGLYSATYIFEVLSPTNAYSCFIILLIIRKKLGIIKRIIIKYDIERN